jgi:hypothetical protein
MKFQSANYEDIKRYYLGCYIKVQEHGDLLFSVDRVNRNSVEGRLDDGRDFIIYMDDENPYEIGYVLPHKSFFQFGYDAWQLYRVPARQYFRGLNSHNTRISCINSMGEHEDWEGGFGFEILKAFVKKQPFMSLSSALKADNNSTVLTPRMVYHNKLRCIFVDFEKVAEVNGNNIRLLKPVFKSEIVNLLRQNNESHAFSVN